jgi:hypothetical protein
MWPEAYGTFSRSTKPTDLMGFVEFGGYRRHYWRGVSASASGRSQHVRVATKVAKNRGIMLSRARGEVEVHTIQSLDRKSQQSGLSKG